MKIGVENAQPADALSRMKGQVGRADPTCRGQGGLSPSPSGIQAQRADSTLVAIAASPRPAANAFP